jgi:hypothetical protein
MDDESLPLPYTVKKFIVFPVPSRDVTNQTLRGRELFPARESLVSDIPAGDGKTLSQQWESSTEI